MLPNYCFSFFFKKKALEELSLEKSFTRNITGKKLYKNYQHKIAYISQNNTVIDPILTS